MAAANDTSLMADAGRSTAAPCRHQWQGADTPLAGSPLVQVRLLGVPALLAASGHAWRVLGRNDALLIGLLAMQGPLPRQRIAALLWPDSAGADAARSLRQRVHQLKRLAATDVLAGDPVLALLPQVRHELAADDAALQATLAADPDSLQGELLDSVDLGALDALAGLVGQWRLAWRRRRAGLLQHLVERAEADRDSALALRLAQRLVHDVHKYVAAHRRLILLHYQLGDDAAALQAYADCRRALATGLGLAPSPATEALVHTVRSARLPPAVATAQANAMLMRPPQLVGRDAAWRDVAAALAVARPVLLTGEAGIGKTRLLADIAAARGGVQGGWHQLAARPGDADLPYALLARLIERLARHLGMPALPWVGAELSRLVPGLQPAASAEPFSALRLQRALREALRAWTVALPGPGATAGPALAALVLDDLHFADPPSLDLLAPLVGDPALPGLRWLMAARPAALAAAAPAWQQRLADAGWLALPLPQLALADVQALLDVLQLPGLQADSLAPRLAQATGGNPLFLLQTLAAMLAQPAAGLPVPQAAELPGPQAVNPTAPHAVDLPAPRAAVTLIAQRIRLLGTQARQLLRLAALAGSDFNAELAAAVLQQPALAIADAWAELEAAQLLRDAEPAHDLVRLAALQDLDSGLARATHRALARALAAAGAAPAVLARHNQAAHDWLQAAQAWDAAAAAANRRSATAEEIAALQAAVSCLESHTSPDPTANPAPQAAAPLTRLHTDLGLRWAQALLRSYEPQAALARLRALQAHVLDDRQRMSWLQVMAHVLAEQQQSDEGLACAQQAMALADRIGDPATSLMAAQRAAKALMRLDRLPEALALMPDAPPALARLAPEDRLYWLCDRALLLEHADLRQQSLLAYDQVISEAQAQQRWLPAADACSNKAVALMYLGRLADSSALVERSMVFSRRAGVDGAGLLVDEMNLAGNWRDMGWFDAYLARAERLGAELRDAGLAVWAANAEHDLAVAYVWLGRVDLAQRLLAPLGDSMAEVMRAARLITRVRLAREFGATVLAPQPQRLIDAADALITRGGNRSGLFRQALAMERALHAAPQAGAAQLAGIAADARAQENLLATVSALRLRLQLLVNAGDLAAAAGAADALLAQCAEHGPPPGTYAPGLWWLASQALAQAAPDRAAALVATAADWIGRASARAPALYRSSFLQRNPVNRAVLQAQAMLQR